MDERDRGGSAWQVIAEHDGAPAVVDTLVALDPDEELTKTELSDRAGVPLKSLYLDGTLDALTSLGLLEKRDRDGEDPLYSVPTDSEVFEAARAFGSVAPPAQTDTV